MNKTENLKLNVWEKSDPILVVDFNEDNRKIDAAVGALTAGAVKFTVGGVGISLSGLAVGAVVGILLNAVLPGKDYEFGADDQGDKSVNFIVQ